MKQTAMAAERAARAESRGMPLRAVLASHMSLYESRGGGLFYEVVEWMFTYALSADEIVSIGVDEKGTRMEPSPAIEPPLLELPGISHWMIDSVLATQLAEQFGGEVVDPPGGPFFRLSMVTVDDQYAPVWALPHWRAGLPILIRADSGAEVFIKDRVKRLLTMHNAITL